MHKSLVNLTAQAVHAGLQDGSILLIDVREPNEHAAERIPGAILFPLSSFDPYQVPHVAGKTTVYHCGIGKRSEAAALKALSVASADVHHLEGGLSAWKQAGLPTKTD